MEEQREQIGFTLIEMLVVMVLTAILATYAISRWTNSTNLNVQAQQLAADIRYTQSLAMTHGEPYRLTFTSPNIYAITTATGAKLADTVTNNNSVMLDTGVAFGTITNLPNNIIAFNGRGSPYINASANTALTSTAMINLTWGNETRQIQITPAGQVKVL